MASSGAGMSQTSELVATALVSVLVLFAFQSIFRYWRAIDKKNSRQTISRGSMDGLKEFLSMSYLGPKVTIENFCNLAGPALGGVAYYYSLPYGPGSGDKVEIYNEIGQGIQMAITRQKTEKCEKNAAKLRLVASSEPHSFRANPPKEFVDALAAAIRHGSSTKDCNLAAARVQSHGPTDDCHGAFLMVGPTSMTEDMSLDMSAAAQAWAAVLNGRLERVREMALMKEHETTSQLYAIGAKMAQQTKDGKIMEVMVDAMAKVMNVEKTTLWFIDEEHDESWSPPNSDFPKGLIQKLGTGLIGHVASRFESSNDFHESIICSNDPNSMPTWDGEAAGVLETKNILAVPVLSRENSTGDRRLVAVFQLINKTSKSDLEDCIGFAESDIRLIEVCADILGGEIARLTVDILGAKANMDFDKAGSGARLSFLTEYYKLEGRSSQSEQPNVEKEDRGMMSMSFVPNASTGGIDITNWSIDYWKLSEAEEFQVLVQGLERLSVPTTSLDLMSRFFKSVKHGYRDNPYHSFHHAIATVHYSFLLLQASKMDKCLRKREIFALLIGALCHDLDHRGFNTAFEVATRSELALRYNDCSPLENHHCAKTFQLAFNGGGEFGDCNIFKDMSDDFYQPMRKTMVQAILGTDMTFHGEHVRKAHTFEPAATQEDQHPDIGDKAVFIVVLCLHTADIANPFMPRAISERWSIQLCEEFTRQVEAERRLEMPVTPFMDGVTTPLGRAKSGLGFAEFVVCPLVNPLFKLFEGWAPAKGYLQDNRQYLSDFVESAKQESAKPGAVQSRPSLGGQSQRSSATQSSGVSDVEEEHRREKRRSSVETGSSEIFQG